VKGLFGLLLLAPAAPLRAAPALEAVPEAPYVSVEAPLVGASAGLSMPVGELDSALPEAGLGEALAPLNGAMLEFGDRHLSQEISVSRPLARSLAARVSQAASRSAAAAAPRPAAASLPRRWDGATSASYFDGSAVRTPLSELDTPESVLEPISERGTSASSRKGSVSPFISAAPEAPKPPRKGTLSSPAARVAASAVAAALFGVGVYLHSGSDLALQYLSTYVVEWTMSIDNLAIISAVLAGVPPASRSKVMSWGLGGTIVARLAMVAGGISAAAAYPLVFVVGGVFLLFVAAKLVKPEWDVLGKGAERAGSWLKARFGGAKWLDRFRKPVLAAALAIMVYDAICALDSVPAALALSKSLPIVFAANVFALLGLRSLLTVFQRLEEKFEYLEKGVAAVLIFVALKMIAEPLGLLRVGSLVSTAVVLGLLGGSMLLSIRRR
jgi:tellurite resistance protein TerC